MSGLRNRLFMILALTACICLVLGSGNVARGYRSTDNNENRSPSDFDQAAPNLTILEANRDDSTDINIALKVDKPSAEPGDEITLIAEVNRDCYLTVLNICSSGRVIRLWPNAYSGWNNRLRSHVPTRLSGPNTGFKFVLDGSQPLERIVAYATTEKGAIFREADFRKIPGAPVKAFIGDTQELIQRFGKAVEDQPRDLRWGTAAVAIRLAGAGRPERPDGMVRVIVEMRVSKRAKAGLVMKQASDLRAKGLDLDQDYDPVPVDAATDKMAGKLMESDQEIVVVRGRIDESRIREVERQPGVVKVWSDPEVQPFAGPPSGYRACDCAPKNAKGTLEDVVRYLGVDKIWARGYKGEGIVIGIVDFGILAEGRDRSDQPKTRQVVGGYPDDWGTKNLGNGHGNMTATDALGMAPNARIYDLRIVSSQGGALVSNIIQCYHWAITQHKKDGTPQVLSNSWGIAQESKNRDYARNPSHPFTRQVVKAIESGIVVLFAAGNCGDGCTWHDKRCGTDVGPGRSIWGANGHTLSITVGAANIHNEWVGYSSQGPAAITPRKPDFCSITHFKGWFPSDSGTSAACPVAAGVVALLKQANPRLNQETAKRLLMETAKRIGPSQWDPNSGTGIIQPESAFYKMMGR